MGKDGNFHNVKVGENGVLSDAFLHCWSCLSLRTKYEQLPYPPAAQSQEEKHNYIFTLLFF